MNESIPRLFRQSNRCSRLESVNFRLIARGCDPLIVRPVHAEFWKFFSQSVSLRRVGWTCFPQEAILANTECDQLTRVCLFSPVYLQTLITLLINAQSLERLIIRTFLGHGNATFGRSPKTVDVKRLHTLKVHFGRKRISTLLDHITCPSLRNLDIVSCFLSTDQSHGDSDSFRKFLSRSKCQLSELSLGRCCRNETINSDQLAQYLTAANGLQSLKILKLLIRPSIPTNTLRLLASQAASGIHHISPNLEQLVLSDPDKFTSRLLFELAVSRIFKITDGNTKRTFDGKIETLGCLSGSLRALDILKPSSLPLIDSWSW